MPPRRWERREERASVFMVAKNESDDCCSSVEMIAKTKSGLCGNDVIFELALFL
jgi:hypothetical protein